MSAAETRARDLHARCGVPAHISLVHARTNAHDKVSLIGVNAKIGASKLIARARMTI